MHKWMKRGCVTIGIVGAIIAAGFAYWDYHYPYGWSHCCDKALGLEFGQYAEVHDGWFPRGEATPEASLSLLYQQNPLLLDTLRGKTVSESVVRARLESGMLLTPETCGWHYVEGLRNDDDPQLALFWDKAGLGHNGERLSRGGHYVGFIHGMSEYITGERWDQFLHEQEQLLMNLKHAPIDTKVK